MSALHGMMDRALVNGVVRRANEFIAASRPKGGRCAGTGCDADVIWVVQHSLGRKQIPRHFRLRPGVEHAVSCDVFELMGIAPKRKRVQRTLIVVPDENAVKEHRDDHEKRVVRLLFDEPLASGASGQQLGGDVAEDDFAQPRPTARGPAKLSHRRHIRQIWSAAGVLRYWQEIQGDPDLVAGAVVCIGEVEVPWLDYFYDRDHHELFLQRWEDGQIHERTRRAIIVRRDDSKMRSKEFYFVSCERTRRRAGSSDFVAPVLYSANADVLSALTKWTWYLVAGTFGYVRTVSKPSATFYEPHFLVRDQREIVRLR